MKPETIDRLLACAQITAGLRAVAHLVSQERRDEFVAATAQVLGCILDVPSEQARAACDRVTAEHDAKDAARKAGQS